MRGPAPARLALALPVLSAFFTTACASGLGAPTNSWQVTVSSQAAEDFEGCGDGQTFSVVEDQYTYQVYQEGSLIDLRIEGEAFATGTYVDGCHVEYTSPAYLDTFDGAEVQWQITGYATVQASAGGCTTDDAYDWVGVETVTITRSATESLPVGCSRDMDVLGVWVN